MAPDAAALPSPPTFAPGDSLNRHNIDGIVPGGRQTDGTARHQNGLSLRFPNIKDLQDEAAALEVNETTSVCALRLVT
jgi:ubiquitin carboxyl-terminal hydrolase 8